MRLLKPRIEIGIAVLIVGVLMQFFFGGRSGMVLAVAGIAVIGYALVRDRGRGTARVVVSILALVAAGSVWLIASRPDGPPPLETVAEFAEEYRTALAAGDFEAYQDIAEPMLGVTLEDAFTIERGCLDWDTVGVAVAPSGLTPFFAVVTFSSGELSFKRTFDYESGSDRWIVTVEGDCWLLEIP